MLINESVKFFLNGFSQILNYPPIKEGVKKYACIPTIALGILVIPALIRGVRKTYTFIREKNWNEVAIKVIGLLAHLSLIFSAAVTRPGIWFFSRITGFILSSAQLERLFGPNTIFAVNPWHPRHVISFAALACAVPGGCRLINQRIQSTITWLRPGDKTKVDENRVSKISQRSIIKTISCLLFFYTIITSRPVLHWGNQFVARVIA